MARLTDERRQKLFDTLVHLVAEHGYERVTMDQVADAARASKATLYRQWGSKAEFFVDALVNGAPGPVDAVDTGSLRGDLLELVGRQVEAVELGAVVIPAVLQVVKTEPAVAAAFREQLVAPGAAELQGILDRAVDRGEIGADHVAVDRLMLVLAAPLVLFQPFHGVEPTLDDLTAHLDAVVLPALGL